MQTPIVHLPDPTLDLVLERTIDPPPEFVWNCWTDPAQLMRWFTPAPWQTVDCEIDLRPGGVFRTGMRGPNGEAHSNSGCYLEVGPSGKLVWTGALGPGYRPRAAPAGSFLMTVVLTFAPQGTGTRYTATAIHGDAAARALHEQMGFHVGWGKALDQLVALWHATA